MVKLLYYCISLLFFLQNGMMFSLPSSISEMGAATSACLPEWNADSLNGHTSSGEGLNEKWALKLFSASIL